MLATAILIPAVLLVLARRVGCFSSLSPAAVAQQHEIQPGVDSLLLLGLVTA
jgi:hypothetical protein